MTNKQRKAAIYRDLDALEKKYGVTLLIVAANVGGDLLGRIQGPQIELWATIAEIVRQIESQDTKPAKPKGKKAA